MQENIDGGEQILIINISFFCHKGFQKPSCFKFVENRNYML